MDRLTQRLKEQLDALFGGNESELARHIGIDPQNINNLLSGKVRESKYWREIGAALQIDDGDMQAMIDERKKRGKNTKLPRPFIVSDYFPDMPKPNAPAIPLQQNQTQPRWIPVLGRAVGGDDGEYEFNGQPIDWMLCPPSLANVTDAYAIFVDGESMVPRYRPGEVAFVHPDKPPRRSDYVVVQLKPKEEGVAPRGFIKKFIGWSANKLFLEQYNPAKKLEFMREDVFRVHLIVMAGDY